MSNSPPRRGKEERPVGRSKGSAAARASKQRRLEDLEIRRAELEIGHLEAGLGEQRAKLIKRVFFLPVWVIIALVLALDLLSDPDPVFALIVALVLGGSAGLGALAGK